MPIKRPRLINGEIYHICVRGVGDSEIFKDENDYYRGIFSIYEFNDTSPVTVRERRKARFRAKQRENSIRELFSDARDRLVEILAFCFMPNHIHLLLRQIKKDGITQFMRKLGAGYVAYFNKKYNRKGHLFQGRFRAVHIKDNNQLQIVLTYIHANCASLVDPNYKEKGIKELARVITFIENYKWSSYQDYLGKKNFPSVTERELLLEIIGGKEVCRAFMNDWIKYKREIGALEGNLLE